MNDSPILFEGNARVYLQGQNALLPIGFETDNGQIAYYIGNSDTQLLVHDHRLATVLEAVQILQTRSQNGFAKHFNQLAHVVIKLDETTGKMEIDIHGQKIGVKTPPTIWMGILENNIMPGYEVIWEVFRAIDLGRTAFVALVPARNDTQEVDLPCS